MANLVNPPTPQILATYGAIFQTPMLNSKQRLAILVQAKCVLLNYKGGHNYISTHNQLTIDAEHAFAGFTPEAWGAPLGDSDLDIDPGPQVVGSFVQRAALSDSTNMPTTLKAILLLLGQQMTRPTTILQKQNVFLDYLLLFIWGA